MLTVNALLFCVKVLVHLGVHSVLQAVLNTVRDSLMVLIKRLELQTPEDLQETQQPAFKVSICLRCQRFR